jgi:hypothetical protein
MDLPNNPDILLHILEFLGPRSTCLTIGSTNHTLRQLSQCDSLWRIFWVRRCLFFDKRMKKGDLPHQLLPNSSVRDDDWNNYDSKEDGSGGEVAVHNAVLTFRHDAIHYYIYKPNFKRHIHKKRKRTNNMIAMITRLHYIQVIFKLT